MKNIPITPELVFGAQELERTESGLQPHRLPAKARMQNEDAGFSMAERQPSGVRLKFRTAASVNWTSCRPSASIPACRRGPMVSSISGSMANWPGNEAPLVDA